MTTFSFWRLALQQRVLIGVSISGVLCALLLLIWALQVRAQSSEVEQQVARSAAELQALREETAQAARAYQDRIRTLTAEKMATAAALRQALAARAERSSMAPATTSDRSRTRPPRRAPEARKAAPRAQRSAARKRVRIPIFDADDPLAGV